MPPTEQPVGNSVGVFSWLTIDVGGPSPMAQCHLCAGGPGLFKKADGLNNDDPPIGS